MADGMVPISREFLKDFYSKYPIPDPSQGFLTAASRIAGLVDELAKIHGCSDEVEATRSPTPHKIDENFYKNREKCEEVDHHLGKVMGSSASELCKADCAEAGKLLLGAAEGVAGFQKWNSERVGNLVAKYLPQDFRGSMILQQKERGEKRREKEVQDLVSAGGSIKEKYKLLWSQQMDRRRMLAQLGASSGVFKAIVKFLAGVPEVLLDFVTKINDEHGPMEEQRLAYGPSVYRVTTVSNNLHCLVRIWSEHADELAGRSAELSSAVLACAKEYVVEVERVRVFIADIFERSPFLITAEEAARGTDGGDENTSKSASIAAGKSHDVTVSAEYPGMHIVWEFSADYEVGFSVSFAAEGGPAEGGQTPMPMIPPTKAKAHEGHFVAPFKGTCTLSWDNSGSWMTSCGLKHKAAAVPPVIAGED